MSRHELRTALREAGVRLNDSAEVLLSSDIFDGQKQETLRIVQRTVGQLGVGPGATLSSIFSKAREEGLSLCPSFTGPYLRLAMLDQASAPDSVFSNGSAPSGSITVASSPLDDHDVLPKGFYLRVIDDVAWLRGYRATDEHIWSPEDRLAFAVR